MYVIVNIVKEDENKNKIEWEINSSIKYKKKSQEERMAVGKKREEEKNGNKG